ncbi:RluA family pseudouridine synthase [Leptospira barantonii]|uniref:RluA family pseudouridine synthase n=1 Tax=Leptospira barantonii TaxID=2023184 RepID=A0A5F2B534_9LEPT|nr:RluA family pseudouridine synthase [Leptospira barantonii]
MSLSAVLIDRSHSIENSEGEESDHRSERLSFRISKEESGTRLDHFLSKKFTYHSRTAWQKEILEGRILLSGKKTKPGILIKEGDLVVYQPIEKEEPPVRTDYQILYEDDFIVAVDKPGDLPVHPAGVYRKGNLLTLLQESKNFGELFTIHRLDRETSGVVLFAKDSKTASFLSGLFSSGNIQKYYITKVYGDFPKRKVGYGVLKSDATSEIRKKRAFEERKIDRSPRSLKKSILLESGGSAEIDEEICLTYFRKIEFNKSIKSIDSSFVLCKPITGRMHQIRATLCSLGFPLWGDKLYGKDENVFLEFIEEKNPDLTARLGMERQALHAYSIRFTHPVTKKRTRISAPLPKDFL